MFISLSQDKTFNGLRHQCAKQRVKGKNGVGGGEKRFDTNIYTSFIVTWGSFLRFLILSVG